MTKITEIVNSLIKKAKKDPDIQGVTFVKAYNNRLAACPVEGFVAVVKIENINLEESFAGGYAESNIKGEMYNVKLELDVFSDSDITGESLSDMTLRVMRAIQNADESSIISDVYVTPIEFDEKLNGIFRKIVIQLDFCLCGDENE